MAGPGDETGDETGDEAEGGEGGEGAAEAMEEDEGSQEDEMLRRYFVRGGATGSPRLKRREKSKKTQRRPYSIRKKVIS